MALTRMVAKGTIRRLARELYDYPKSHPIIGTLAPSPDAIAKALVGRHNIRLLPSGAYAANLLGLSEQVPAKIVFLTDGPSCTVLVGNQEIGLKQTTPRTMGPAGRTSGLVIQALRDMGQQHVDDAIIQTLRRRLRAEEREQLLEDLGYAPAWVRAHLRAIANGKADSTKPTVPRNDFQHHNGTSHRPEGGRRTGCRISWIPIQQLTGDVL